jgi:hypothetical protein
MPILLPNLDDRTWADLVEEGTSLIPVYGPEWTDQNYSDPGITLVELLAAITEMDIYRLNRISDREKLRFLSLVGVRPAPPAPAETVLTLTLAEGIPATELPVRLPKGLEFAPGDGSAQGPRFRIVEEVAAAPGLVAALQMRDAAGLKDLTPPWRRRGAIAPFGVSPLPGAEFYVGLTQPLPIHQPTRIFFTFAGAGAGLAERHRLLRQSKEVAQRCRPQPANPCRKTPAEPTGGSPHAAPTPPLRHYGVRTVWEYHAGSGGALEWAPLEADDDTRAFTLNGAVTFRAPAAMRQAVVGDVSTPLYYLRCRFEAGSYDAAPLLQDAALNGVAARQSVPIFSRLQIAPGSVVTYGSGGPPQPYEETVLRLSFDSQQRISQLAFDGAAPGAPRFRVLSFDAPTAAKAGSLLLEGGFLGFGNGLPFQQATLSEAPLEASAVSLYTQEDGAWREWELRPDFDASTRKDSHVLLEPTSGVFTFGNGENGRVAPPGCLIFAVARATRAQAGNLPAGAIDRLADSPHNHALLYNRPPGTANGWKWLKDRLASASNALPATGGAAAETVAHASGKADRLVESSGRAVTPADYERLAAATPGARVARVTAIANMHPDFPCLQAPGMITIIVLPYLPAGRPMPSRGLLAAVNAFVRPHRVIGTRVEAVAPTYLEVAVQATVQAERGANRATVQPAIVAALNQFFDPLTGGPNGAGWPFGRDVFRSEVMKVIDGVPEVAYVVSLALLAAGGQPQCGNVCLGPTWLVSAGRHEIAVL